MAAAAERLIEAHTARAERMMASTHAAIQRQWLTIAASNEARIGRFAEVAATTSNVARMRLAHAEAAFYSRFAQATLNRAAAAVGIDPAALSTESMRGISDRQLWDRPISTYFAARSEGLDRSTALRRGWYRASELADEQMQLTRAWAARQVLGDMKGVDSYVRKPNRGACGLCVTSALKRYRTSQLMPSHPHCRCSIVPSFVERRTPLQVTPESVVAAVAAAGGAVAAAVAVAKSDNAAVEKAERLVAVNEHGELGPTLGWANQEFTGPNYDREEPQ